MISLIVREIGDYKLVDPGNPFLEYPVAPIVIIIADSVLRLLAALADKDQYAIALGPKLAISLGTPVLLG